RRQQTQADDDLLEALLAVETATATRDQRVAALAEQTKDWEATQARLRAEGARLKAQLPARQARQAEARRAVPPQFLTVYDSLRPRRGGRAVAEIDGEECSACNVAISPTKLEAARYGDQLVYCDNCGRLLWGE
ncbi:MAG TPA: C4-type zinc ribbon domain-containing protein, partial [Anaerolineae bacterium]